MAHCYRRSVSGSRRVCKVRRACGTWDRFLPLLTDRVNLAEYDRGLRPAICWPNRQREMVPSRSGRLMKAPGERSGVHPRYIGTAGFISSATAKSRSFVYPVLALRRTDVTESRFYTHHLHRSRNLFDGCCLELGEPAHRHDLDTIPPLTLPHC